MKTNRLAAVTTRSLILASLCAALMFTGSCRALDEVTAFVGRFFVDKTLENPDNPFADVKTVAILPFVLTNTKIPIRRENAIDYAQAFASELAQFEGFTVVRAYDVSYLNMMQQQGINVTRVSTAGEVAEIGRTVQADAVIICKITDYDPYTPPRMGVELQMFRTADFNRLNSAYTDLSRLSSSGKPVIVASENKPLIIRFEEIYDTNNGSTLNMLKLYALNRAGEDSPAVVDQYKRESKYIRFVSNMLIRRLITIEEDRQDAERTAAERAAGN